MLTALLLTAKDMLHDWIRTLINVISLAVVVVSYLILSGLAGTMNQMMYLPNLYPNLVIIENEVMDPGDARVDIQTVNAVNEFSPKYISRVSPMIFHYLSIADHITQVRAAPLEDWTTIFSMTLLEGRWPVGANEVVAGEGTVDLNQWHVGDNISIFDTNFSIVGIYRSPGNINASVWMTIEEAQHLFGMTQQYNLIYARVAPGADPEKARQVLSADPRLAGRFTVYFEDSFARRGGEGTKDIHTLLSVVSITSLLTVILGTFNNTSLNLVERSREIGILRAIGFTHNDLRGLMLLRSVTQVLLAFLIGLLVTLAYTAGPQKRGDIVILGALFSMRITPTIVLTGLALVLLFAMLGAWLPTRRLLKLNVADALSEK